MPTASPDEATRLTALAASGVLTPAPDAALDDCTAVSAHLFGTPVALVSVLDRGRLWFKSRFGLDATEGPRDGSLCEHVVRSGVTLVVPDARADARFAADPLVVGGPGIRFYAGAVFRGPTAHPFGTLCVIDRVPRTPTPGQVAALEALARQVTALVELRWRTAEAAAAGMVSLCAWCRKVRDPDGGWVSVEGYILRKTGLQVSHGICGACQDEVLGAGAG